MGCWKYHDEPQATVGSHRKREKYNNLISRIYENKMCNRE
jgi:hypothetical protein